MKTNPQTNKPFTTLELSNIAREYYIGFKAKQIYYGYDMLVATDGQNTMNVMPYYIPESDDIRVFYLTVRRQVEDDGFQHHIGIWDVTDLLPTCPACPQGQELHIGWQAFSKHATPEYYRKNKICYKNGRPESPKDQDLYDREKRRRRYSKSKIGTSSQYDAKDIDTYCDGER